MRLEVSINGDQQNLQQGIACLGSYGNLSARDGAEFSELMRCKDSVMYILVYCIDQQYCNCYVIDSLEQIQDINYISPI